MIIYANESEAEPLGALGNREVSLARAAFPAR